MRAHEILIEYRNNSLYKVAQEIVWKIILPKINDRTPISKSRAMVSEFIYNNIDEPDVKREIYQYALDILFDAYSSGKISESTYTSARSLLT